MPNYILTNSNPCATSLRLLAVAAALHRCCFGGCSQLGQPLPPDAPYLHLPSPNHEGMLQTTRQGGGRTLGQALVSANFGNGEVGCRSAENLSTAAEMGGAARRERERHAPSDALREAPASAQ